jgi:GNAT superfamily N-acetyltransferase
VRQAWRRQGIAAALLRAADERFRAFGAARIDAMVLDDNTLGESYGWRATAASTATGTAE